MEKAVEARCIVMTNKTGYPTSWHTPMQIARLRAGMAKDTLPQSISLHSPGRLSRAGRQIENIGDGSNLK